MFRRWGTFVMGLVLVMASGLGLGQPAITLATISTYFEYTSCPSFDQIKADVASITDTGYLEFGTKSCVYYATSTITTQANSDVEIYGNGMNLHGNAINTNTPGSFDLIDVGDGATLALYNDVLLEGSNGVVQSGSSSGSILLSNSTIVDNAHDGIRQYRGIVSTILSTVSGNGDNGIFQHSGGTITSTASDFNADGLGISQSDRGTIKLADSTVRGSSHEGIYQFGGSITLTGSTLHGNALGGINQGNTSNVSLSNSTISGNGGDGIFQQSSGTVALNNSAVINNGFNSDSGGIRQDSGTINVHESDSTATITNSTISGNDAYGIAQGSGSTATFTSSTISSNGTYGIFQDSSVPASTANLTAVLLTDNGVNCGVFSLSDHGYNLSDDGSCAFTAASSHYNVPLADFHLGSLGNYGGQTQTVPLQSGSIALDAIPSHSGACTIGTDSDQRGVVRPQGAGCDIGAYEKAVPNMSTSNVTTPSAATTDTSLTLAADLAVSCAPSVVVCPDVNEGIVTFSVTNGNGQHVGTDASVTVSNGTASASFVPTGLVPGSYTVTASYHDPNGIFADSQVSSPLIITPGPPAQITLDPGDISLPAGTSVTETATVKDAYGNLVADGTNVTFSVTGTYTTSGNMTTHNGQAFFSYTGQLVGQDTLTATAQGGTNPSTSATITWTIPTSTAFAQLALVNVFPTHVSAYVLTELLGSGPTGLFNYSDGKVTLSHVHLQALVTNGKQAMLYGTADLADHTPVSFRLDATGRILGGTYLLRLSNGYDSGTQNAMIVAVR